MALGRCHITRAAGPPTTAPAASGDHYVDTTNNKHYLSVGTASVADWICVSNNESLLSGTVLALDTLELDSVTLAGLCTIKYIVCLSSTAQDKWRSFEMLAGKATGTTVQDTLYSVIGSALDVDVDFTVSGPDAKLIFTNNETFDVSIKLQRNIIT